MNNPCIIILAYPNTDEKLNILIKSLNSVKNYHEPIESRIVNVEYSYLENDKLINNTKTYYV